MSLGDSWTIYNNYIYFFQKKIPFKLLNIIFFWLSILLVRPCNLGSICITKTLTTFWTTVPSFKRNKNKKTRESRLFWVENKVDITYYLAILWFKFSEQV